MPLKLTVPPENLAPRKSTVPPENLARPKSTVAARERRAAEVNWSAAGELGAAGKLPPSKTTPVKSKFSPCQDTAASFFEVCGDDSDDGVANLAAGLEGKPHRGGVACLSGLRLVWRGQKGTSYVDAGLPVRLPVICQACHGVYTS